MALNWKLMLTSRRAQCIFRDCILHVLVFRFQARHRMTFGIFHGNSLLSTLRTMLFRLFWTRQCNDVCCNHPRLYCIFAYVPISGCCLVHFILIYVFRFLPRWVLPLSVATSFSSPDLRITLSGRLDPDSFRQVISWLKLHFYLLIGSS